MGWNFHRAHPAPVEHSTPVDQKMLLKKQACTAQPRGSALQPQPISAKSSGATHQGACCTPGWALSAMSLEQRPKGDARGDKTKDQALAHFLSWLSLLLQSLCVSRCRMWSSKKKWSYATGLRQLFCLPHSGLNVSALSRLCRSSALHLCSTWSLTDLLLYYLFATGLRAGKENKSKQSNYLLKAEHVHLQHTPNLWHHWLFKQIRRITARSNVK